MLYGQNMLNLKFLSPMNFLLKKVGGMIALIIRVYKQSVEIAGIIVENVSKTESKFQKDSTSVGEVMVTFLKQPN